MNSVTGAKMKNAAKNLRECGMKRRKDMGEGSRPDGEMVGDGWALTPVLGVGNETQWQSWPALVCLPNKKC